VLASQLSPEDLDDTNFIGDTSAGGGASGSGSGSNNPFSSLHEMGSGSGWLPNLTDESVSLLPEVDLSAMPDEWSYLSAMPDERHVLETQLQARLRESFPSFHSNWLTIVCLATKLRLGSGGAGEAEVALAAADAQRTNAAASHAAAQHTRNCTSHLHAPTDNL
jgi:hypothetical protein